MKSFRGWICAAVLTVTADGFAQPLHVGQTGTPFGSFPSGSTAISFASPASRDGVLTSATFPWSASPCPAAVAILFYRLDLSTPGIWHYHYLGGRGPFDVTHSPQSVVLDPPFPVQAGDLIAITGSSGCGAPIQAGGSVSKVLPAGVSGDIVENRFGAPTSPGVLVEADDDALVLLGGRFRVTLDATDPRSGQVAAGRAATSQDRWGYFSLPELTGDPGFPEVLVKMADATALPPPFGGSFWFFHAPLTDVRYRLTVVDTLRGTTRIYESASPAGDRLCGAADTSAFPP